MTATTLPCEQCGHASQTLYTWRDPTIKLKDRCQGHGILDICAECLCANGGPDYRGLTVGDLLFRLNAQRKRQPSPKPGEKGKGNEMNYKLVTYREDGETYDLEEQFEAGNDAEANAYAEQRGLGTNWENDWFVLRLLTRPGRNHPSWTNINE